VKDAPPARFRRVEGRQLDLGATDKCRRNVVGRQIEQRRRHRLVWNGILQRTFHAAFARLVIVEDERVPLAQRLGRQMVEHHGRFRQIVENRLKPFMEKRQPVLHAGKPTPFADRSIERVIARWRAECLNVVAAEPADRLRRKRDLAHRLQRQTLALAGGALRRHVEGPDRFQRVAEEVEPQRFGRTRRIEIKDAAAHREFANVAHGCHPFECGIFEPRDQGVHVDLVAGPRMEGLRLDGASRRNALQDGVCSGQDYGAMRGPAERDHRGHGVKAARGGIRAGRNPVVGQAIPSRKLQQWKLGGGKRKRLGDCRQALPVAGNEDNRPVAAHFGRERCKGKGFKAVGNAVYHEAAGAPLGNADGIDKAHLIRF
jgi:hypothetical protein